jgi:cullin-4
MIDSLVTFKRKLDSILQGPFHDNQDLLQAVRAGFEVAINKRQDKPAEMLGSFSRVAMLLLTYLTSAKYIDAKMRQGNKALTDAEQEQVFDQVLYLFRFTQGTSRSYRRSLLIP